MALHIAYRGEHPFLFYGQNYMGALEAYIGALLFHQFLLPFEVTSILVLIAIMGAVLLASRPEPKMKVPEKES